jgi:hypothetical protein
LQGLDKQGLNDQGSSVPGHVVGRAEVIAALHLGAGAAAEVVQEVVGELDQVHHRLRALDDLSVQRRLDVGLKKDDIFIIFLSFPFCDSSLGMNYCMRSVCTFNAVFGKQLISSKSPRFSNLPFKMHAAVLVKLFQ